MARHQLNHTTDTQEEEIGRIKRLIRKRNHRFVRKTKCPEEVVLANLDILFPANLPETPLPDETFSSVDCPFCDQAAELGCRCPACQGVGRVNLSDLR